MVPHGRRRHHLNFMNKEIEAFYAPGSSLPKNTKPPWAQSLRSYPLHCAEFHNPNQVLEEKESINGDSDIHTPGKSSQGVKRMQAVLFDLEGALRKANTHSS